MNSTSKRRLDIEGLETRTMLAGDSMSLEDTCASSLNSEDGTPAYVPGDANYDGHFDQLDIQAVLQAGKYRTGQPADWTEGDWNLDSVFDQRDLIFALQSWPDRIPLPKGFEPEGIERGQGHEFFVGAYSYSGDLTQAGSIYKGNLCSGEGQLLVEPTGKPLGGLSYDSRTDYVYATAGLYPNGFASPFLEGEVVVYNGTSGELIAEIPIGDNVVVNDVLVKSSGVFATDSINTVLYKIPLQADGTFGSSPIVESIAMKGFEMVPDGFNANGVVGDSDTDELVVVNISSGLLYRVNTESGESIPIQISGDELLFQDGDGLYLDGRTLYVMQNFTQKIAVVQLSEDFAQGTFVKNIVSDDFAIPTTIFGIGNHIYAVNTDFCFRTVLCGVENPNTAQVQSAVIKVSK